MFPLNGNMSVIAAGVFIIVQALESSFSQSCDVPNRLLARRSLLAPVWILELHTWLLSFATIITAG